MDTFQYSNSGLSLTKSFEGLRLEAYQDGAGIWTIGYGHIGSDVREGLLINEDQATQFLIQDIQAAAEAVNTLVTVAIAQNQFDAPVDFCLSDRQKCFASSTLLHLINLNDFIGAYWQFGMYVYEAGKPCPDLAARRNTEARLFRQGVYA